MGRVGEFNVRFYSHLVAAYLAHTSRGYTTHNVFRFRGWYRGKGIHQTPRSALFVGASPVSKTVTGAVRKARDTTPYRDV
jgi:hypothetical protein